MKAMRTVFGGLLLAPAILTAWAPAALARPVQPPELGGATVAGPVPPPDPQPVIVVSHHGSPLWVFVLVAVSAVALTIAGQLVLSRLHRGGPGRAAAPVASS